MTHEIIIGIIFFALPVITITAFFVAGTIIKMQERNDQNLAATEKEPTKCHSI